MWLGPQSARPSVPSPPHLPDYKGVLPQRKPKKAKLAKAVAAGYFDVYGSQVSLIKPKRSWVA